VATRSFLFCISLTFGLATGLASANEEKTGDLIVAISGFKNNNGDVKIALVNEKEQYLSHDLEPFRWATLDITDNKVKWEVHRLPVGSYAITVFHDENQNGDLDANFLGIPNELFGFSNNSSGFFGPPNYDEALFNFDGSKGFIKIMMK